MNINEIRVGMKVKIFPPMLVESNVLKYGTIIKVDKENRKFTVDVIDDHIYIYSIDDAYSRDCIEAIYH